MTKSENIILVKSYEFALKIVNLYKEMIYNQKEYELSKQILKSGTSIGANSEEAAGAQSKKDFIAKLSIAYKESRETNYWLRLLKDSEIVENEHANSLITDCEELQKILTSILKTAKAS